MPTTIRMDDSLAALIEGAVKSSETTDEIPSISQSELIRLLLWDAGEELLDGTISTAATERESVEIEPAALVEMIPDHKLARYYRETRKEEGWYIDMLEGFEGRVRDELGTRFKRGYDPAGIERRAKTFIGEAHDLWGRIEGEPDTAEEMAEYVRQVAQELAEEHDAVEYDAHQQWLTDLRDDVTPDTSESEVISALSYDVIRDARSRIQNETTDRLAIATVLSKEYAISEEVALSAIEIAESEPAAQATAQGGVADD